MQSQSIAIIGAGTAGLATAALLARQGHAITLIERAPALEPVGAGLLLQPSGLDVLKRMGLYQAMCGYGAHIDALVGHTCSGRAIMNSHYRPLGEQAHGLGIHRASLCHVLDNHLQTLPHQRRMGCTVIAVDAQAHQTLVTLEDNQRTDVLAFDAVLIANGSHSQLRPSDWTRYDRLYPWGAMWAMVPMAAPFDVPLLQQRYHRASAMAGILPTGCRPDQPDTPLASFFWSLPVTEMASWQQPDFARAPFENAFGKWRNALHEFWPELDSVLTPLTQAHQLTPATYRDVIMHQWGENRLGVIGDAAHAMSPQLGQGANMALLDAWALGEAMQQSDNWNHVWAHYHQQRGPHIRFYQRMSRWLTPAFQSHSRIIATGRDMLFPLMAQVPWLRLQMAKTVAGLKTGLLR